MMALTGNHVSSEESVAVLVALRKEKKISTGFSMRICVCRENHLLRNIADFSSDGPTPEAKTQQILAITPILQGQKPSQQFNTPPQHQQVPQQPPQQFSNPPPAMGNDLIDFGQGAPSAVPALQQQAPQQYPMHHEAVPPGLQQSLEPAIGQPVHRVDTATDDVDEFVDAEDGR